MVWTEGVTVAKRMRFKTKGISVNRAHPSYTKLLTTQKKIFCGIIKKKAKQNFFNILQYIFICVEQKKSIQTSLKQVENE